MMQRTTTDLVDLEYSVEITTDNTHGSTVGTRSRGDQEHLARPGTSESLAQSSLWPAEVLYEHNFYTDVWYTDIAAYILMLIYACGIYFLFIGSDFSSSALPLIMPQHWLPSICIFCLYLFIYVIICICSKLYPSMLCFRATHTYCRRFGLLCLLTACTFLFVPVLY